MLPTRLVTTAYAILFACLTVSGAAQTEAPPVGISAVPEDFDLVGTWKCEGKSSTGQAHHAIVEASVVLHGKWLQLQQRDAPPIERVATYLIGYDWQANGMVEFKADDFSGGVYRSKSIHWTNDSLTLTSVEPFRFTGPRVTDRFVYTVLHSGEFTMDWQIQHAPGKPWISEDLMTCTR